MTNSLPWKPWPICRWFTSLPIKNGDFPWLTILIVRINGRFHQKMRTDGWGFVERRFWSDLALNGDSTDTNWDFNQPQENI